MINYYLCDACKKRNSIPGEICPYRLESVGKIVCSNERNTKELCVHHEEAK